MSLCGSDADVCSSALLSTAILGCGRTEPPLKPLSEFAEPALPALPNDPRQTGQMSLRQESTFLFASTDDIIQLSKEHPWMGPLDQQLAGKAYRAGASLAFRI